MELPLPDVERALVVRTSDEIDEKLLSVGIDVTVLDVTEIVTVGPPLSNADEPLGELIPLVDEDPPPWELLEISVDDAAAVKVLGWELLVGELLVLLPVAEKLEPLVRELPLVFPVVETSDTLV